MTQPRGIVRIDTNDATAPRTRATNVIPLQVDHGPDSRFHMRQRILTFDDVYWVENAHGQPVFQIDGKALRTTATLKFKDAQGLEIYRIHEKLVRVRDLMRIYCSGDVVARVHNAIFTPLHNRFRVELSSGNELTTHGSVLYHEYEFEQDDTIVARVSKRWFHEHDSYGVEVRPGEDALLVLAITVIIDIMAHDGR